MFFYISGRYFLLAFLIRYFSSPLVMNRSNNLLVLLLSKCLSTWELVKYLASEESSAFVLRLHELGFNRLLCGQFKSQSENFAFAASVPAAIRSWISFLSFTFVYFDVIGIKTACLLACFLAWLIYWIIDSKLGSQSDGITGLLSRLSIPIPYASVVTRIVYPIFILPISLKASELIALFRSVILEKLDQTNSSNLWG